jgi:hypothetical protein
MTTRQSSTSPQPPPMTDTAAQIIYDITKTANQKSAFVQLCLDLVVDAAKEEYGKHGCGFGTSIRVAANSKSDISQAIAVYLFEFAKAAELNLEEDYYVGQSLLSAAHRWTTHTYFLSMATAKLKEGWPKSIPTIYWRGHQRTEKQISKYVLADLSAFEEDLPCGRF